MLTTGANIGKGIGTGGPICSGIGTGKYDGHNNWLKGIGLKPDLWGGLRSSNA